MNVVISNATQLNDWARAKAFPLILAYIKTNTIVDWAAFEEKVNRNKEKYWSEILKSFPHAKVQRMLVQPLPDLMFSFVLDNIPPELQKSKPMVVLFGVLGFVVLVIAWINYLVLALSRANKRMKEVATRKVTGARFMDFARQFILEALVLNIISLILGLTILQFFSRFVHLVFDMPFYDFTATDVGSILILISVFLTGTLVTGLYPAIIAARNHPRALFYRGAGNSKSTKVIALLTTAQYGAAATLILWAFIMYLQLNYLISKSREDAGESVLVMDGPIIQSPTHQVDYEYFVSQVGKIAGVADETVCRHVIGDDYTQDGLRVHPAGSDKSIVINSSGGVDENFIPFFDFQIVAGRNFLPTDRGEVIILSERAVERLGFSSTADAIGARVRVNKSKQSSEGSSLTDMEIIGVLRDYRYRPYFIRAAHNVPEMGLGLVYKGYLAEHRFPQRVVIRVDPKNAETVLSLAKKEFETLFPGNVFNWYWLDEHIAQRYRREETNRNQIGLFTCVAIGVACLGLLGMMSHQAVEKTKEIGIRKILGARLRHITHILLRGTLSQLVIALVIALPVAFYLSEEYLEKFSERITLQWWHFVVPVVILISIMLATIASVLFKAATSNPVEALKHE